MTRLYPPESRSEESKARETAAIDDMALPYGKTCADCWHIRRCTAFGFTKPEWTRCDFAPSRFVARKIQP
jgi:hypothetical protein